MLRFKPKGYTYYAKNVESCCMVLVCTELYNHPALEVVAVVPSLADRIALELNIDEEYFDRIVERMSWFTSYYPVEHSIVGCVLWTENDLKVKPNHHAFLPPFVVELDVREAEYSRIYEPYAKLIMDLYGDLLWFMRKESVYVPEKPVLADALVRDTDNLLRSFLKPYSLSTSTSDKVLIGNIRELKWLGGDPGYQLAPIWTIKDVSYYNGPGWCLQYTAKEFIAALRWVYRENRELLAHYGLTGFEIHSFDKLALLDLPIKPFYGHKRNRDVPPWIVKGNGHVWCTGDAWFSVEGKDKALVPLHLYEEDRLVSKYCLPQTTPSFVYN